MPGMWRSILRRGIHRRRDRQRMQTVDILKALIGFPTVSDISGTSLPDDDDDIAFSTLHVGRICGGIALNIVPKTA